MGNLALATVLLGAALLASMVSVELGISVALVELALGVVVGNAFDIATPDWLVFIASFAGIVLTFPSSDNRSATAVAAESPAAPVHPRNSAALSQDFMKAGIEEIARLREWATTLASAIRGGYGVTDEWVNGYRDQASQNLQLADAAATTDGDRNAAQLLHHAFDLVQQWSDKLVTAKKSMDTAKYSTSPDALREDPLSQKIITCGRFLTQMLGSATFQDDASCH